MFNQPTQGPNKSTFYLARNAGLAYVFWPLPNGGFREQIVAGQTPAPRAVRAAFERKVLL